MREKRGSLTYYEFQLPFNDDAEELVNKRPGMSQFFDGCESFLLYFTNHLQLRGSCERSTSSVLQCNSNFIANLNYLQLFIYS